MVFTDWAAHRRLVEAHPYGTCPVCDAILHTYAEGEVHQRRHGERRYELAKCRVAQKLLLKLPKDAPERPWVRLVATPRVGMPEEERDRQNTAALALVLDRGGTRYFEGLARRTPDAFEDMVRRAERVAPDVAARIRAAVAEAVVAPPSDA